MGTILPRLIGAYIFSKDAKHLRLANATAILPSTILGALVISSYLKGSTLDFDIFIKFISGITVLFLQHWLRNAMLSISIGTLVYVACLNWT